MPIRTARQHANQIALSERLRKVGDRRETITIELTPEEIEAQRSEVVDLVGRKANLEAARKSLASEYKAKIELVEASVMRCCQAATSGKRTIDVDVEEWLTQSGKVIRVRTDTGEVLPGDRAARADERQEALFDARTTKADLPELGFPPAGDVFGT